MIRVYQFGLRPPVEGQAAIRRQLRYAHDYTNDLVQIERGWRWAMRQVHETDAVREAIAAVRNATRSTRKDAMRALHKARREAERAVPDEIARITGFDEQIRRDARNLSPCYWGHYLDIESALRQARQRSPRHPFAPLYDDDGVTPADPKFRPGPRLGREAFPPSDSRATWWLGDGQLGAQLQQGLSVNDALGCHDTQVRIELRAPQKRNGSNRYYTFGVLWLRVESAGRDPVWAKWPILLHRQLPNAAIVKWVRVSVRREVMREIWTCEITLDIRTPLGGPAPHPRTLDTFLSGAIAVEPEWTVVGEQLRIASWIDSSGARGSVLLPARVLAGLRKPAGIRAVRDLLMNDARQQIPKTISLAKELKPRWLLDAHETMPLWRSPQRLHALAHRWRKERHDGSRAAYDVLQTWERRDVHLWEYEAGARSGSLRARREIYRCLAAAWGRRYQTLILPDRDYSREARFAEDSDARFLGSPSELVGALRGAFGWQSAHHPGDVWMAPWRDAVSETDEREWRERAIERYRDGEMPGLSRSAKMRKESDAMSGNAWAARKRRAAERRGAPAGARKPTGTDS